MAQPPPQGAVTGFHTRGFPEIRNPVYAYNQNGADFKRTPTPRHVLESHRPVDENTARRTSQGSVPPVAGLTPIIPAAYQTPYNVWGLYPA